MKRMSNKKKPATSVAQEPKFAKEALVNSKRFRNERDVVSALLEDGAEYAISEVEGMIMEYMKGKVK
jgi:hypothetical protein